MGNFMKNRLLKLLDFKRFKLVVLFEGLIVGIVGGLVVVLYRICLSKSATLLQQILAFCQKSLLTIILWFVVLIILAKIVSKLLKYESLISGSGIPQLEGELAGKIDANWWRGFLSSLAGLALGREGPSIQLGAMVGKGVGKILKRNKTEERYLLTCGASAGLAAAFHAPLAGVMFALEEVHKHFSAPLLISVMTSSIAADYLMSQILSMDPIFNFEIVGTMPTKYYWMLLILGVILGILGAFYNKSLLTIQKLYDRFNLTTFQKLLVPFILAGILGFTIPELIGNGDNIVEILVSNNWSLNLLLFLLIGKFLFAQISFGSGAPGGIFFPLLVIGCIIGAIFGQVAHLYWGLEASYINNFILLAMAGYFTAIVRAPVTGIILIFEMTGTLNHLLSIALVTIVAYIVADLLKSKPIYESLLENLLKKRNLPTYQGVKEKVLLDFMIVANSHLENKQLKDINWPDNSLIVSLYRDGNEFIPRGNTYLKSGDTIMVMCDKAKESLIYDQISKLINT